MNGIGAGGAREVGCAPGPSNFFPAAGGGAHVVRLTSRVSNPDRTGLTAGLRYRFTGPVRPDTGRNRTEGSLNLFEFKSRRSNGTDRYTGRTVRFTGRFGRYTGDVGGAARTGKPAGYTGIPAGWTGIPVSFPPLEK